MYVSTEDALREALKNEQARRETMEVIEAIRKMGGEATILRLAGAILTATPLNFKSATA
ncbi:hypothetical protein [Selenomonas sp. AB3002]|jgi:hypothetical protein|uniref:hypothetical protein n=1 Tax=Selenomonas sp. AB3002 TaxID=1392502 RepID=UPI000AC060C9